MSLPASRSQPFGNRSGEGHAVADPGWITGAVVDGAGQPVAGALVNALNPDEVHGRIIGAAHQVLQLLRLNGTMAFKTGTDGQGRYRFQGLAPGRYRVSGGGNGWLPWRSKVVIVGSEEDVEVNGQLRRGANIHGVLRSAGESVRFVDLLVRKSGGDIIAAATTDQNGRYRVSGLRPGSYQVGIVYDGSPYQRHAVAVVVAHASSSVERDIVVRKGALITVSLRVGGKPARRATDELRDSTGRPILGQMNAGNGQVEYTGLSRGTYTIVGATKDRYLTTTINVTTTKTYAIGRLALTKPTLTLTGTTSANAVVEATTADRCPPDAAPRPGAFTIIEKADPQGHYVLHGLVPGSYMLGADGWPDNYAPRCWPDVKIAHDMVRHLSLEVGGTVRDRLVYGSTGTPVITALSYGLSYPAGVATNPTNEHPARAQAKGASGRFTIDALSAGAVTGALAHGADLDQINDLEFIVIYPFQDGTPYYLTSKTREVDVNAGTDIELGDIELTLHR
ncbi:MAG: carboxypeptidase regulatory-like domain-containing protein [Nocardioidaceae bacterium]